MHDAKEIAKHNSRSSCYVIIDSQIYDLTRYLNKHPGGSRILLDHGGQDATALFESLHPKGTIERALKEGTTTHIGAIDPTTIQTSTQTATFSQTEPSTQEDKSKALAHCFNIKDVIAASRDKFLNKSAHVYFNSAADDLRSLRNNDLDWQKITLRPRILRHVRRIDTSRTMLGRKCQWPVFIAPAARAQLAHHDGEKCLARTAARRGIGYCVSSVASIPHDEISTAFHGVGSKSGALWFQLYVAVEKEVTMQRIQAAIDGGYSALIITVDSAVIGKREEDERHRAEISAGNLAASFAPPLSLPVAQDGGDDMEEVIALREVHAATLTWDDLEWIKKAWGGRGPVGLKGIQSVEDAVLAVQYGLDAIYLSNHGGRQCDDAPSSIKTLLEIRKLAPQIIEQKQIEIYLDGGVRRGTDVVKALCLGATGVGMGRPYMYACSFGDDGVNKIVEILVDEIQTAMRLIGATSLTQLDHTFVNTKILNAELSDMEDISADLRAKL